ncbi:uncharacterized protein [Miscanthus floridulus]|uniref:uncharacterized protein n=1 Tax=Miscanthus floridulus TaxID=154761 RepID=UPI00345A488F
MPCALSEAQAHIPHRRRRPPLRCGGLEAARARARGHYRGGAAEVQAGGEEEGFSEDLMFFVATYLSELTAPSSQDSSFRPARRLRPDGRGESGSNNSGLNCKLNSCRRSVARLPVVEPGGQGSNPCPCTLFSLNNPPRKSSFHPARSFQVTRRDCLKVQNLIHLTGVRKWKCINTSST